MLSKPKPKPRDLVDLMEYHPLSWRLTDGFKMVDTEDYKEGCITGLKKVEGVWCTQYTYAYFRDNSGRKIRRALKI